MEEKLRWKTLLLLDVVGAKSQTLWGEMQVHG